MYSRWTEYMYNKKAFAKLIKFMTIRYRIPVKWTCMSCIMWVVAGGGNSAELCWEILPRLTADIKGSECNIMEKGSKCEN